MAPYGSAIKAWPSGQIMATPMITRRGGYPVRYAAVASARLAAFRRKRPIDGGVISFLATGSTEQCIGANIGPMLIVSLAIVCNPIRHLLYNLLIREFFGNAVGP